MHGRNSFQRACFQLIALLVTLTTLPVARAACQSVWLPAPDNRCAAYFTQSQGAGPDAFSGVHVECSYEEGGFSEEVMQIFADRPIPLRWIDAKTLEIGLPAKVRATPLKASSGLPSHVIRYKYGVLEKASSAPLHCLEPSRLRPQDFRMVSSTEAESVHTPGWITYAAGREACMLIGQSLATSRPEKDVMSYQFTKYAKEQLPLGTTDLVFAVEPWRQSQTPREAPEIRLSSTEAPIVPAATGPGRSFQLRGAAAERVLKQISEGSTVSLAFKNGNADKLTVDISRENFAGARVAFDSCVSALPAH